MSDWRSSLGRTFAKGVKVIDTRTGAIVKTYQKTDSPRSLIDNSVFSICQTTTGDIYLGTLFGLLRYNKQTDDFDRIPELNGKLYMISKKIPAVIYGWRPMLMGPIAIMSMKEMDQLLAR